VNKPNLSWIPVRLMEDILVKKTMTAEQWLRSAPEFGLGAVEIYYAFLESTDPDYLQRACSLLKKLDLEVSMLTCSPDFAHPSEDVREQQLAQMKTYVDAAGVLDAPNVRVTTGMRHPEISEEEGIEWVVHSIELLGEYASAHGVTLALEDHYKDRFAWEHPDFAQKKETFLAIFDRLRNTPVMVNFDCSNPIMVGDNPLDILQAVKGRVVSVHASDRFAGVYQHSVIGEGMVDFDPIFKTLRDAGFTGWISAEDGNPEGDDGFRRSLAFLRRKIEEYWAD